MYPLWMPCYLAFILQRKTPKRNFLNTFTDGVISCRLSECEGEKLSGKVEYVPEPLLELPAYASLV